MHVAGPAFAMQAPPGRRRGVVGGGRLDVQPGIRAQVREQRGQHPAPQVRVEGRVDEGQVEGRRGLRMADYTQAQMDFGATLCTRADPACVLCPLQSACVALREGRVDELPTPKPGKPLPERRALMLWIEDADGRVLMQRRPPTGIWGSLWSLPEHGVVPPQNQTLTPATMRVSRLSSPSASRKSAVSPNA